MVVAREGQERAQVPLEGKVRRVGCGERTDLTPAVNRGGVNAVLGVVGVGEIEETILNIGLRQWMVIARSASAATEKF